MFFTVESGAGKRTHHEYCSLFFQKINEMLTAHAREKDANAEEVVLNPFHLKDDEHGGNKTG